MNGVISNLQEISLDGFQVISGELFCHPPRLNTPALTLWYSSMSFNKASLIALNNCERILIKVNPATKCILIVPVNSKDKDGIRWMKTGKEPTTRKVDCQKFTSTLYEQWGWPSDYCYRALGRLVTSDSKVMVLFDFTEAENWKYKEKEKAQAKNEK